MIFGRVRVQRDLTGGPFAGQFKVTEVALQRPDGVQLRGWRAQPLVHAGPKRVLLYFGGRNEDVIWAPKMASYLTGWTIYALNHRGMGASDGRPRERLAQADSLALWSWVRAQEGLAEGERAAEGGGAAEWAIAGRSLGSAIALQLAAQVQPKHLILLSPFCSLQRLLSQHWWSGPLRLISWRKFRPVRHAPQVHARTLVLLAAADTRIPRAESLKLVAALPHAPLVVEIPGTNHQSLPRHVVTQRQLAAFLRDG